jgi:hypothetical protein
MARRFLNFNHAALLLAVIFLIFSCKDEKYSLPIPKNILQNDAIKRSQGPNVVGLNIEFAYAMALPQDKGKLVAAEVVASIPGAAGTYLEHNSYFTNSGGVDIGVPIGLPSVTVGDKTTVTFTKDTMAATLRYFYVIPEAARGKTVTFTFSAKSSNGESVSITLGPYTIAKMDFIKNRTVTDGNAFYISISDTAIYTTATAAANAAKIDLVYLYRVVANKTFLHALVAPAADPQYLPGITLPPGVNKNTKILKVFNLQDYQLANLQYGIYIDDLDFQKLDLSTAPNFAINLKAEAGVWVETADGKYRAYIYINSVNNTAKSAVISMKRYAMQ